MDDPLIAPGFYDDGTGTRRWWNGQAWTDHTDVAAVDPERAQMQQAVLGGEISRYAAQGWSVESRTGDQAILQRRVPMSFFLNLIGVLITFGLWLIYILVRLGSPQFERLVLTVDQNGVVRTGARAVPQAALAAPGGAPLAPSSAPSNGVELAGLAISILALLLSFSTNGVVFLVIGGLLVVAAARKRVTRLVLAGAAVTLVALLLTIVGAVVRGHA